MELDGVQLTGFRQQSIKTESKPDIPSESNTSCLPCFTSPQSSSPSETELVTVSGDQIHTSCDKCTGLDDIGITVSNGPVQGISQSELITKGIAELHVQDGLSAVLDFTDNGCFDLLPVRSLKFIPSF